MDQERDIRGPEKDLEFERWLDETMEASPEDVEAERLYWDRREKELEDRLDRAREEGKRF